MNELNEKKILSIISKARCLREKGIFSKEETKW
jgi:hypothetical protein